MESERSFLRDAERFFSHLFALSSLKRAFGPGETLATTLIGLATRIAAKVCAYIYASVVNRILGRPQGRIEELWA